MYVGTHLDYHRNILKVAERINGQRFTNEYPLILEYYIQDNSGYFKGTDGKLLKKIELKTIGDIKAHKESNSSTGTRTYELNNNLTNKVLYEHYKDCDAPVYHKSFIDIEVDLANAPGIKIETLIEKANCPINAVSVYNDWEDTLYTFMLCPDTMTNEEAKQICSQFPTTFLYADEKDLIRSLIAVLDDADVISGWNSSFFDIPYIIRRTEALFVDDEEVVKGFCLWGQKPIEKKIETYGKVNYEYSLVGKWSGDYLLLYKKHTPNEHESYKLDNIAFEELGERKVAYDGSLDNLYRENYKLFIEYNRQDTMLVYKLDKKLNYINIHNRQAHQLCVPVEQTMGTVAWFDQACLNFAHKLGLIVPDKDVYAGTEWTDIVPPGAFVQDPVVGVHEWISDTDLNSLYPSIIRCLNMSPETIVAQVKLTKTIPYLWKKIRTNKLWKHQQKAIPDWGAAWGGDELFGTLEYQAIMQQTDEELQLEIVGADTYTKTAKELYDIIFAENSGLCISAFGTIFKTTTAGIVAQILTEWYSDRKAMKKKSKWYGSMKSGVQVSEPLLSTLKTTPYHSQPKSVEYEVSDLKKLIKDQDVTGIIKFMDLNGLQLVDDRIEPINKDWYAEKQDYWDLEQYLRKINLNSAYGALLNSGSLFYDFRLGASTTISGRKIVQHMASKLNELSIGEYKHKGGIVVYGDTDSTYFSVATPEFKAKHPDFVYTKEKVIEYVDWISSEVDKSYAEHVKKIFHVTDKNAEIIRAAREIIATRGLYVSKKRYALLVYDDEGTRYDVHGKEGKLKIKGLQIQRSDTPKLIRDLLKDMMNTLLVYNSRDKLVNIIKDFYNNNWGKLNPWEKGSPSAVNQLDMYVSQLRVDLKTRVPGHVMASINWNRMIEIVGDKVSPMVKSGDKVVVCKLKPRNSLNMSSIAIPIDINTVPKWFKELPFDEQSMEDSVVDKTMDSIFGVLNWGIGMNVINEVTDDLDGFLTFG